MTLPIVRFANIVFAALIAGGMFVIWVGYDPAALSPSTYVEQQQNTIRALVSFRQSADQRHRDDLGSGKPAATLDGVARSWWGFHRLKTFSGLIALVLITWASVYPASIG